MIRTTRILGGPIVLATMVLALLATKAHSKSEAEERSTNWSEPRAIAVPSDGGTVKGIVRIRPLPRREDDDGKDPLEVRMREIDVKALFIPRKNLLWIGASEYERFFVVKDKIAALYLTAGADLSISIVSAPIPKTADPDKALSEELDARFRKIAAKPLRYQYWINLRKLFGQDAFVDEHNPRVYSVPKISGVSFNRGNAVITLVGKNPKISTLTFDGGLQVIAASRDGHPIPVNTPIAPRKLTTDKD